MNLHKVGESRYQTSLHKLRPQITGEDIMGNKISRLTLFNTTKIQTGNKAASVSKMT